MTVPVGALLGAIAGPGSVRPRPSRELRARARGAPAGAGPPWIPRRPQQRSRLAAAERMKAAPAARALAKRLGIDLERSRERTRRTHHRRGRRARGVERACAVDLRRRDGSPLLLIAGFGVDKTSWRRQLDDLAAASPWSPTTLGASALREMAADPPASTAIAADAARRRDTADRSRWWGRAWAPPSPSSSPSRTPAP